MSRLRLARRSIAPIARTAVRLAVIAGVVSFTTVCRGENLVVHAAQPLKMRLDLKMAFERARSQAPFSVEIALESGTGDLVEGDLDLTFVDGKRVVGRQVVGPIVISNGRTTLRAVLPAMEVRTTVSILQVQAQFHTSVATHQLAMQDLYVPVKGKRQFLIAAVGHEDAAVARLTHCLQLDAFQSDQARRSDLLALPVGLDDRDIPLSAIGFYPFDLLVVAGEHFSRLSPKQLDAIAAWVEIGGRVVVVPSGVLTPAHLHFLERVAAGSSQSPIFLADQHGRLMADAAVSRIKPIEGRLGFGRAVILRAMPQFAQDGELLDVDAQEWTRAVCFLWNVRPEQTRRILQTGTWRLPDRKSQNSPLESYGPYDDLFQFRPADFSKAAPLAAMLFPEDVRVVPFGVVVATLTLFLIAVAPGDYFVLGWLRLRRFTWILFPSLCVLFTIATVSIAGHYTGTIDHRSALVIVDMGEGGKPLRTTRIEHVMTAQTRPITTTVRDGVFAVTDIQPSSEGDDRGRLRGAARVSKPIGSMSSSPADERDDPAEIITWRGNLPASFDAERLSRQWTPRMQRVTRLGTDVDLPAVPWTEIDRAHLNNPAGRDAMVKRLRKGLPDCELLLMNGSHTMNEEPQTQRWGPRFVEWAGVMAELSRRRDARLFSLVSQIAPNGAGDLEDLAVVDDSSDDWLVHLAVRRGEDLIVFRRLVRSNSNRANVSHDNR